MTRNVRFSLFLKRASTLPSCQWTSGPMIWNGVTGVIKIAQIVMRIPMHLCQSQLLLYQRNGCFPEATLILISRRRSKYNVPRSGAIPRSGDIPRSGLFPDLFSSTYFKLNMCAYWVSVQKWFSFQPMAKYCILPPGGLKWVESDSEVSRHW